MLRKTRKALRHYDFIEIGTSDFNTLIQKAKEHTVGLSVEPMIEYLNRLPDRPTVVKVNAAVSEHSGFMDIYYIPDDVRISNKLPSWMKGTNKIGAPHPTVVRYLNKHELPLSLITHQRVPVLSVERLFRKYRVGSLDYLKIDTEGHDSIIMNAYLNLIERKPALCAKRILFESNALSSRKAVADIIERLKTLGYEVEVRRQDTLATLNH